MTDAPKRIWLPLAHAEDAANQPADDLIKYARADLLAAAEARVKELEAALEVSERNSTLLDF